VFEATRPQPIVNKLALDGDRYARIAELEAEVASLKAIIARSATASTDVALPCAECEKRRAQTRTRTANTRKRKAKP
jgi:hypothetical protein